MKLFGGGAILSLLAVALRSRTTTAQSTTPSPTPAITTPGTLSIPNLVSEAERQARAAALQLVAGQVANEKRTWRVGATDFPFYDGPVARSGSLAERIQQEQVARLNKFRNTNATILGQIFATSTFNSLDDYTTFYDNVSVIAPHPMSTDFSDETFGYQRTTIKGFNLHKFRVGSDAYPSDPSLAVPANVAKICGKKRTTVASVEKGNALFVSDLSNLGTWSDPAKTGVKFTAPVVGYFCYNEDRKKLLPLAIRIVSTGLTYTPFDRAEEWTMAKMALETAEITFQQMQHLADSHAMLTPVQIEVLRNLSPVHPVSALLLRFSNVDYGIEVLASQALFNYSTAVDLTFGFGPVGCIQFLDHQMQLQSVANDFEADIESRGLEYLPNHKYARFGKLYNNLFKSTIGAYLSAYYPSDAAVAADTELQNWAKACAAVSQLRDFPTKFKSLGVLRKLLTYLVFQTTVRHHAMNGVTSWESVSVPYATPGLWHALPTKKLAAGETLNVLDFSPPKTVVPSIVGLAFAFNRFVPENESLLSFFKVAPFTTEPKLASLISNFESTLRWIDSAIVAADVGEKWPYRVLRPSMLASSGWL
ncbi:hypothetical protein PybrP1_005879 [[Pythium] brassicae (nom. inval.)]|nr:hypothetical protein PybrP1_005879 [[Pythium] brassicae (nom. inval.)]